MSHLIQRDIEELELGISDEVAEREGLTGVPWSETFRVDFSSFGSMMII